MDFPDATIPAGGYLIVYCSGTSGDASELHASFRLSGEGTQVILTRADGQTASMADVPALEKDQSWSKQGGGWTKALSPTPGQSNDFSGAVAIDAALRANSAANVILSEIAASSSTVGTDWIELYNAGTEAVDLSGWGLSDSAGRPRKWQFSSGTTIAPGQYLGVLSGRDKQCFRPALRRLPAEPGGRLHGDAQSAPTARWWIARGCLSSMLI